MVRRITASRLFSILLCIATFSACHSSEVRSDTPLGNDRFGNLGLVQGQNPKGPVVILFSGNADDTAATVKQISLTTSLIIQLDSDRYLDGVNRHDAKETCTYLAGEIERLGQSAQSSQSLESLRSPFLIGVGKGAGIAYAVYAEHPQPFSGVATWGNSGTIPLQVPVCKGDDIAPDYDATAQMVSFATRADLSGKNLTVSADNAKVDGAPPLKSRETWLAAVAKLVEYVPGTTAASVVDLPVVEIRAAQEMPNTPLVVFLSGDGGWAAIDKEIGRYLSERGVDVVGVDMLKYFWSRKTALQTANDVGRIITSYQKAWHKNGIILAGFSLGAEHVPFVLTHLSEPIRKAINLAVMLSPGKDTDFEVHITDWLGMDNSDGNDLVAPEINKAAGVPMLCIYGRDEAEDSSCVGLPANVSEVIDLPGGHHLNDDYMHVGELLLARIKAEQLSPLSPSPAKIQ